MEVPSSNPVIGDELAQEVDKKGTKSLPQSGFNVASLFKNLHFGKVTFQHQQEPEVTKPLAGYLESKDLVSRSDAFGASIFQSSHTYTSGGMKLVFHDMSLDADLSIVLTHLLECHKLLFGKVKELANIFLQTPIYSCINQDGRGSTPCTLILSIGSADVRGITCIQSPGKVKLTERTTILQVPLANPFTEEVAKEIAEKFQFHYNEGIRVVYPLRQRFFVTTIKGEKPLNVVRTKLPGEMSWGLEHQLKIRTKLPGEMSWGLEHQLKITELVGLSTITHSFLFPVMMGLWERGHFKSKEDLFKRSSCHSDKQFRQVGMGWRGSIIKNEGQARDEFDGQGEAPTSSSARGKESGKTLRSGVQKQVVVKIKKY